MEILPECFAKQACEAFTNYNKYVICLNKTNEQFTKSLISLLTKAIKAYNERGDKKNGIALDKFMTVTLTENEKEELPTINIYFNLYSDYAKKQNKKAK